MMKCTVIRCREGWESGTLLMEMLDERGVLGAAIPGKTLGSVCYGGATSKRPALNANCQLDKMERLHRMQRAGVPLIRWTDDIHTAAGMRFPLFARKATGYGAKDLMPVFQPEELPWRVAAGWSWFSEVIPIAQELRVWVFRGGGSAPEVLDTYEKVMRRPREYTSMGRNFAQGFEFEKSGRVPGAAAQAAIMAVQACGLDFGAVDLIVGTDGRVSVLEVNTAPGVIRSGAQATLGKLADRIAIWATADCPELVGV